MLKELKKLKLSLRKCNWEGINYLSEKGDWKNFEKK